MTLISREEKTPLCAHARTREAIELVISQFAGQYGHRSRRRGPMISLLSTMLPAIDYATLPRLSRVNRLVAPRAIACFVCLGLALPPASTTRRKPHCRKRQAAGDEFSPRRFASRAMPIFSIFAQFSRHLGRRR